MPFGQLVIGPPGSGKTTFCNGMLHYFQLLGADTPRQRTVARSNVISCAPVAGRKAAIVNLDPGNDSLPYEASPSRSLPRAAYVPRISLAPLLWQCAVNIDDLVALEAVQEELGLGAHACNNFAVINLIAYINYFIMHVDINYNIFFI